MRWVTSAQGASVCQGSLAVMLVPKRRVGWVAAGAGSGAAEAAGARAMEMVRVGGWVVGGGVRVMEGWVAGMVGCAGAVVWERAVEGRSTTRRARRGSRWRRWL